MIKSWLRLSPVWIGLFLQITSLANAKLLVITHSYQRPDFIELQYETFRKFLKDDYEFVVFNDAERNKQMHVAIESTCKRLGLRSISIPQEIHSRPYLKREPGEPYDHACVRCANVVQYSLDTLGFDHDGLVMIIDSDMFLVQDLNVAEFMQGYDISGFPQARGQIEYIWNAIVFLNMNTLPAKRELNFNCGRVEGEPCDAGGYTYYYFKNHPEARFKDVPSQVFVGNHIGINREDAHPFLKFMLEENVTNCEFFMNYTIFHYRGGGNWDNRSTAYHEQKTAVLHKLLKFADSFSERLPSCNPIPSGVDKAAN